jgi:plastocyanin
MLVGSERLMTAAEVFRLGAPPRVLDEPVAAVAPAAAFAETSVTARRGRATLSGVLTVDGVRHDGPGVVILIPDRGARAAPPPVRRVVEQRDGAFAPRLLAVPVGSTVAFPNFDSAFHNVFSLSKIQPFDLGMYGRGAQREVVFDTPGVVRVGCSMHPEESAYIVVVDAPYHALVGDGGAFELAGVRPGAYTMRAWTDRSGEPTETRVQIEAGDNERDLNLAAGRPLPSTDKFGIAAQDAILTSRR